MDKIQERKEYALSKVAEYRNLNPCLDISLLVPATNPAKLANVNLAEKQMAQLPFHPIVLSVICGTLFGDSSIAISKNYANARIQNRHSTRQTDWFMWKTLCILQEFVSDTSICWQEPDGFCLKKKQLEQSMKEEEGLSPIEAPSPRATPLVEESLPVKEGEGVALGKWKVATKVDQKLTQLYNIICPRGNKQIQRFWLNHMNNYFLMALWLDDGSLSASRRQGVLSCNNTPKDQANILANYICKVWEVECKVVDVPSKATKTLPNPIQIVIKDLDNLEKLLRIIAPIIPVKSMLYKVCLFPIESSRLQRWTSELKTLIRKDWHSDIDKIYADLEKKSIQKKI